MIRAALSDAQGDDDAGATPRREGDVKATRWRHEGDTKATRWRHEGDKMATRRRREGDTKATRWRHEGDKMARRWKREGDATRMGRGYFETFCSYRVMTRGPRPAASYYRAARMTGRANDGSANDGSMRMCRGLSRNVACSVCDSQSLCRSVACSVASVAVRKAGGFFLHSKRI